MPGNGQSIATPKSLRIRKKKLQNTKPKKNRYSRTARHEVETMTAVKTYFPNTTNITMSKSATCTRVQRYDHAKSIPNPSSHYDIYWTITRCNSLTVKEVATKLRQPKLGSGPVIRTHQSDMCRNQDHPRPLISASKFTNVIFPQYTGCKEYS